MARKPPRLAIDVAPAAGRDLHSIWEYNAKTYGPDHSDRYLDYLARSTSRLATDYVSGRWLPGREQDLLQYTTISRRRGYGYVVIYRVRNGVIEVLRYFHSAQDWQNYPRLD